MSETRLTKYLQLPRQPIEGTKQATPVILSDSKGLYLKNQVQHPEERNIVWWCKKGATIEERLHWLGTNINSQIREQGNIHLYIWLGTCNLTKKGKSSSISIANQHPNAAEEVIDALQKFKDLMKPYPDSRLTILEIPHYSIVHWNTARNHPKPETFKEQDEQLQQQIDDINKFIYQYNTTQHVRSLPLNNHLKARKQAPRGRNKPHKAYYNYNLYTDGIHPKPILARAWLKEINEQMKKDCWHK